MRGAVLHEEITMKLRSMPWIAMAALATTSPAMADMDGIAWELVGNDLIPDSYTIRLFAEIDEGDHLLWVGGTNDFNLRIEASHGASFYQNTLGGPTSQFINTAFFPLIPSLEWDSYVTIGATSTLDNGLQHMGMDWSSWDPDGGDLVSDNGLWFVTSADEQGAPIDGRVLIGQFTIQSGTYFPNFYFQAMFHGIDADGTPWSAARDFAWLAPGPSGLVLLGLVMMQPRRRRQTN